MVSKTTLAEQLASMYMSQGVKANVVHSPGPISVEDMKTFMETELGNHPGEIKIFDRFSILEEYVYGTLLRGKSRLDDEEYNKSILDQVDLFVLAYPGLFSVLNWGDREQMDGVKEKTLDIINQFNHLAVKLKESGYNVKEYNYHVGNYKELVE